MFVDGRRSDVAWLIAVLWRGVGRRESEEPILEKDVLWGGIDTNTRRIRGKIDKDLIVGQFWNG